MFSFILFIILSGIVWGAGYVIKKGAENKLKELKEKDVDGYGGSRVQEQIKETEKSLGFANTIYRFIAVPVAALFIIIALTSPSILDVDQGHIAQFEKRIMGTSLKEGKIIATSDEMGPQDWIVREGFHIMPFVNFVYDVTIQPIQVVPAGHIGKLVAKDGLPLEDGEYFAPDWKSSVPAYAKAQLARKGISAEDKAYYEKVLNMTGDEIEANMIDATFFLKNGGKKGPQYNVLKPGKYPLNTFLFDFAIDKATVVNPGEVGVVTAKYGNRCEAQMFSETQELAAPLVDEGCIGVWKTTITTGNYYFNPHAMKVDRFPIRVQSWIYSGGYTPREVDVSIGEDGKIVQHAVENKFIPVPEGAADSAIQIKTKDKWRVYTEIRMQVQPEPKYASAIFASVGGLKEIENKGITPALQSVLRNMGERHQAKDFIEKRSLIEAEVEKLMIAEGKKYGVTIKEIRFGHVDVEPAVMTPGKITQLSKDLAKSFKEQEISYKQLIKTNETKATADQQPDLVKSKIQDQAATYQAAAREKAGIGEEKYLKALARGQEAQKAILGEDKTYQLQVIKVMAELCEKQPEVCSNSPLIYSVGGGADQGKMLESFGALGLQNIIKAGEVIGKTKGGK